jgi:hypothetical protein
VLGQRIVNQLVDLFYLRIGERGLVHRTSHVRHRVGGPEERCPERRAHDRAPTRDPLLGRIGTGAGALLL